MTKVATVKKEFDNTPGWQHLLGGFPIADPLDPSTKYFIEPRGSFSEPTYSSASASLPIAGDYYVGTHGRIGSSNITVLLGNGRGSRTTDGVNFTACSGVSTATWNDIEANANKFISVSSSGVVNSSNDGATWSDISGSVGSDTFTGVAAIGQTWIIVSDTGIIYRSTDNGSSWTNAQIEPYDGSTPIFKFVAAGNGLFITANQYGQTWESVDDGVTWQLAANVGLGVGGPKYIAKDLSLIHI